MRIFTAVEVAMYLLISLEDLLLETGVELSGNFDMCVYVQEVLTEGLECSLAIRQDGEKWESGCLVHFNSIFPDFLWENYAIQILELARVKDKEELVRDFLGAVIANEGRFDLNVDEDPSGKKMIEISVIVNDGTPQRFETTAVIPLEQAKAAGMRISVNGEEL